MEFRVEGILWWNGVVPDAGARGKAGSGWWAGVSAYCELEKWADILHTEYGVQRIYITFGLGVLGRQHAGSRGALAKCLASTGEQSQSNPWIMLALDRRFFRSCIHQPTSEILQNAQATPGSM